MITHIQTDDRREWATFHEIGDLANKGFPCMAELMDETITNSLAWVERQRNPGQNQGFTYLLHG